MHKKNVVILGMIVVCVITILLFVVRGMNVDVFSKKMEHNDGIPLAISSVGETSVGTNVKATFNGETGEVRIYSTSGIGTIDRWSLTSSFYDKCGKANIISITFQNKVYAPTNSSELFRDLTKLQVINNANNLNVSKVINMWAMFCNCGTLKNIVGLSDWDVSSVTTMQEMFVNCRSLASIEDLSNWNVSSVTTMQSMFVSCSSLSSLDLSKWNVNNVINMISMFNGCSGLTSIGDLSNWNVSNVKNMTYMFDSCRSLTSIGDLSNWNVSNVTNMANMFNGCSRLSNIGNLSNWNVSNVTRMSSMFNGCSSLTSINLSNWDMTNVTSVWGMFNGCEKIEEIYTPAKLPSGNLNIILPKRYKDANKPEERNKLYNSIQTGDNKFSKSVHLFDGIFVSFDLDIAEEYFLDEYTDNIKARAYSRNQLSKFGGMASTGEKLLPYNEDGKAILWDEDALRREKKYEFLGWECSYDHQYYDVPFVANYFPESVIYTAVFDDKNIIKYDLELSNIGKETDKLLTGAQYKIEGTGRKNVSQKEYMVSENGTLEIEDLYVYEEYTLTQRRASNGYNIKEEPVKFKVIKENDVWKLEVISGNFKSFVIEPSIVEEENTKLKIEWEDEILFKVRKVDSNDKQLGLQGAKFTIKYKNNDVWEYAKDINGEIIGTKENINGEEMYVVTTDENGYIYEEVMLGEYQITEVDAPEGYKIPDNPVQYLNIELLQNEKLQVTESWATKFTTESEDAIERVLLTKDGGRIFVGKTGTATTPDGIVIVEGGECLVVKYNKKGQRTWGVNFKYGYPNMVTETHDEGLLILGNFGMAKYKKNELYGTPGQEEYVIEWESRIVTQSFINSEIVFRYVTETSDNGFIVQGRMNTSITLKDAKPAITLNKKGTSDIFIIKYKRVKEGEYVVEWTDTIATGGEPFMTAVQETSDEGILLGGAVQGYVNLPDGSKLTNNTTIDNTVLFKYTKKKNGKPGYDFCWGRRVTGDNNKITGITETTDGKYVVAGYFGGKINIPGMESLNSRGGLDNLVMVFNEKGEVIKEGVKQIGGSGSELLNHVARTNDGGYVTVGSIASNVKLENGQEIKHNESGAESATDISQRDAIVTRYDKNMNTVWARTYGGFGQDHFTSVFVDKDNNILLGTYFKSNGVTLENKEVSGGYLEGYADSVDAAVIQLKEYIEEPQSINYQEMIVLGEKIPKIEIEILKKWDHTNNKYEKPKEIKILLKANGEELKKITITRENKIEIEGEPQNQETWRYVITELPQCTKYGEKIEYTIEESV